MLKQSLQQKLLQKLSPQQIQLMKLLQVPTLELEARIKQELEANPALEEGAEKDEAQDEFDLQEQETSDALEEFDFDEYLDDETPDYQLSIRNHGADVEDRDIPLGSGALFRELLVEQLGLLDLDPGGACVGRAPDRPFGRRRLLAEGLREHGERFGLHPRHRRASIATGRCLDGGANPRSCRCWRSESSGVFAVAGGEKA